MVEKTMKQKDEEETRKQLARDTKHYLSRLQANSGSMQLKRAENTAAKKLAAKASGKGFSDEETRNSKPFQTESPKTEEAPQLQAVSNSDLAEMLRKTSTKNDVQNVANAVKTTLTDQSFDIQDRLAKVYQDGLQKGFWTDSEGMKQRLSQLEYRIDDNDKDVNIVARELRANSADVKAFFKRFRQIESIIQKLIAAVNHNSNLLAGGLRVDNLANALLEGIQERSGETIDQLLKSGFMSDLAAELQRARQNADISSTAAEMIHADLADIEQSNRNVITLLYQSVAAIITAVCAALVLPGVIAKIFGIGIVGAGFCAWRWLRGGEHYED